MSGNKNKCRTKVVLGEVTRAAVCPDKQGNSGRNDILSEEEVKFLENVIIYRDKANSGMSRAEVIRVMMQMKPTMDEKKCKNHLDHLLIRKKNMYGVMV